MTELYDFYTKHLLGTVLIIVCFLIIRFLLRKKSNILKNMLWIILLLRLIFPFSIYTNWGILLPTATVDKEIDMTFPGNQLPADQLPENKPVPNDMESPVVESENISDVPVSNDIIYKESPATDIRMIIWYLGVILFFVYYAVSRIHLGKRMKRASKMPDYDNVYEWQDDFAACVIGVIRPRIYVPHDLKKEQLNIILQHENMHIKRGDYILLVLYFFALALNWYNPLCWVVYFMVRSDIEMACDEQVLRNCSKEERQNYARILLQLCSAKAADKFPLVSFARGKKHIEQRVVNIGENYTYKKWVYAGVGILSVAIVAGGVFLYANADNNSNDINLAQISTEKATEDFGADMPRLGYVDERTLFIYDYKGIYKFDLPSNQLVDYVDFKEQNLGGLQGDNATEVNFSADGQYIYLRSVNDEVKLIYDTVAKKIKNYDFNDKNIDPWRVQIAKQDTIENDRYYNVSEIIQRNGEMCFLALQKNMEPNYAALIYVVSDEQSENIYTLFNKDLQTDAQEDNETHVLADGTYISQDGGKESISFDLAERRFSFDYDPLSSYYPTGTVKVEDGVVTATTDDNKYVYIFEIIDNDTICFVQEGSNVVKTVEGETPVVDGTRFTFVEYALPPKESVINEQNPEQAVLEFSQNFINTLNGAIARSGKVNLGEYIKNKNLLTFAYKMVDLTHKQDVAGENMTTYGGNNKFGDSEIEELEEGVYYLYIPFQCEGTGMVCQLLVKVLEDNMEIVDFYFGNKDGIDTMATGHPAVRKVDDPERWNDEAWVAGVFSNIEDYEKEKGIQYSNTEDEEVRLLDVKFFQNGKEINYDEGWYPFGEDDVEIYLIYQGKPNYVEVLSTPTGTNVADTEKLIHREYIYNNTGNYTLKVSKDEIGEGTHYLKVRIYHLDEDVSDDLHVFFE